MAQPNILLQGIVPDTVGSMQKGFQFGQQLRQAPLLNRLNELKVAQGELGLQESQQEMGTNEAVAAFQVFGDDGVNFDNYQQGVQVLTNRGFQFDENEMIPTPENIEMMNMLALSGKKSALTDSASTKAVGGTREFVRQVGTDENGKAIFQNFRNIQTIDPIGKISSVDTAIGDTFTEDQPNPLIASKVEQASRIARSKVIEEEQALTETTAQREEREAREAATRKEAEARAGVKGKATGETEEKLENLEALLPNFMDITDRLGKLAETATFTTAGRLTDTAFRELGFDVPEGADARAAYSAIANNEVLPLLRQMLGAAFTAEEGKRVLALLGDLNKSPSEKQAELDAFVDAKQNEIKALRRKLDRPASTPKPKNAQQEFDAIMREIK